ncbi:hypothetical protein [Streptomyces sp. NPDC093223]|uniref:hypothetical protein n=1 Tax=Streptomyces sp. NPDC093223 TaxID=3366033 RepID=UPI00381BB316
MTNQPTETDAIHRQFGLTYANYLVMPRTLLQSMDDAWQTEFVALLRRFNEAFAHVPQAKGYKVEAATEHEVSELDEQQRAQLGITEDWYRGETPPEGLTDAGLLEWEAEHEDPEGPVYYRDGQEIDGGELVMLPAVDPVPHYQRGRTYIEPKIPTTSTPSALIGSITIRTESVQLDNGECLRDLAIGDSVELRADTGHEGLWIAAAFHGDYQDQITLQYAEVVEVCGDNPKIACEFSGTRHAHPVDLDGNVRPRPTA